MSQTHPNLYRERKRLRDRLFLLRSTVLRLGFDDGLLVFVWICGWLLVGWLFKFVSEHRIGDGY